MAELIGPILHLRTRTGAWVPDYTRPGVVQHIAAEVDLIEAIEWRQK